MILFVDDPKGRDKPDRYDASKKVSVFPVPL